MGTYVLPRTSNCPSQSLLAAVVVQAVDDLDSSDRIAKYEANLFFREQEGGWADMRKFYFGALGIHEAKAIASLTPRFSDVEPPASYFDASLDELLELLPRKPFTAREVAAILGVRYNKVSSHFQVMMRHGKIRRLTRGVFARHDYVPPPAVAPPPKATYADVRKIVHDLLRDRPHKFKDLIMSTEGNVSEGTIRTVLRNGLLTSELVRSWDAHYSLAPPQSVVEPDHGEARSFEHT